MSSNERIFLLVAFIFGVVGICAGASYLRDGKIEVKVGQNSRAPAPDAGRVVGGIQPDDALFYPIAGGWIVVGIVTTVLAPVTWLLNSRPLGVATSLACVAFLALGGVTVAAGYWYGAEVPPDPPSVDVVSRHDGR